MTFSYTPSPRPRGPLYRLSLPGLQTRIGTAEELASFGQWLAGWIDAGYLDSGTVERDRRLDYAAAELTSELVD